MNKFKVFGIELIVDGANSFSILTPVTQKQSRMLTFYLVNEGFLKTEDVQVTYLKII